MDVVSVGARWHRGGESSTRPLRWRHEQADEQSAPAHRRETRVRRSRQLQTDDDYAVARSFERAQIRGYQGESTVEDAPVSRSPHPSPIYHEGNGGRSGSHPCVPP